MVVKLRLHYKLHNEVHKIIKSLVLEQCSTNIRSFIILVNLLQNNIHYSTLLEQKTKVQNRLLVKNNK